MSRRLLDAIKRLVPIGLLCALLLWCGAGHAAGVNANPCAYQPIDLSKYGMKPFVDAPVLRAGVDKMVLDVKYTNGTEIAGCPVHLRSYNGGLVGPTLVAKPGDTLDITLNNALEPGPVEMLDCNGSEEHMMHMMSGPEVYDTTNLHTHGLHVSPSGCQDNVFLSIKPKQAMHYKIEIPADQPPGTFWYHAHLHGSTAVQVSSGVEGAIIIEGGLDQVPAIKAAPQRIFLLQQISYNEQGEIPSLPLPSWSKSQREITVNGQIAPVIEMRPGEIQRWRFIHGGVRETIKLYVESPKKAHPPLYEIATDGLALGRLDKWQNLELDPGYRSDVLFQAPTAEQGRYFLYSGAIPAGQALEFLDLPASDKLTAKALAAAQDRQLIAVIDVKGEPVAAKLPTGAELAPYAPYKRIADAELTGKKQTVELFIEARECNGPGGECLPCPKGQVCKAAFMVDNHQYPAIPVRQLQRDKPSEWVLSTQGTQEHPFHIHVNAFQLTRKGPTGADEVVWKDTLMVHGADPVKYRTIRSRYEDFTGKFVLHCHILPHEDEGMMQAVEILP